ncbi:MAG: hypothetical protein HKN12_04560 [Gemmatimonadetes bacterium]|nr:hypothetical protein [Gemmatimonadota bacterium]
MNPTLRQRFRLEELRRAAESPDVVVPEISAATVGWHVHHLCLSMTGISKALLKCTTPPEEPMLESTRSLLDGGTIPRGAAETPDVARPRTEATAAELAAMLDESERLLGLAAETAPDTWFRHVVLGPLRRDDALRFAEVHNRHHLEIIQDLLGAG